MNRKKASKVKETERKKLHFEHPYDNVDNWLMGDFERPPWDDTRIKAFQDKLDSAFGAKNAIILAWSGDKRYGDAFYTDWFANGLPKGKLERKPPLLFAEYKVNETDYVYISCPRWLLLEVSHISQYKDSWEANSWVSDDDFLGGRKRIRAIEPPEFMYSHFKIIAEHDAPLLKNAMPPCCEQMLAQNRICYGRYKEPSDEDIASVRRVRENQDKAGVTQRNDEDRSTKLLQDAAASTRYFIKRAQEQRATQIKDVMLGNSKLFFGDILEKKGSTMSYKEMEKIVRGALEEQDQERYG